MTTGANILAGRALARNGALTLDTNQITRPSGCGNPVACNQGAGNDVDENAEQSNDAADRHESVKGATDGAYTLARTPPSRASLSEGRDRRLPVPWLASVCFMQFSLLGQTYAPRSFVWMKLPCQVWYQT